MEEAPNLKDFWKAIREEQKEKRTQREQLFMQELPNKIRALKAEGITVRVLHNGYQIQLVQGGILANYHPRSGSFYFQRPRQTKSTFLDFDTAIKHFRIKSSQPEICQSGAKRRFKNGKRRQ